jgi:hypothetical protein
MFTVTPTRNLTTAHHAVNNTTYTSTRFNVAPSISNTTFFTQSALLTEGEHMALSTKERINFYDKVTTTPLVEKFTSKDDLSSIIDPTKIVGNDFFTKSLDFNLTVKTLREHIERHVMGSVFKLLNVEERVNAITRHCRVVLQDNYTVNLLEDYATVDLNTVMLSIEYYVQHSNTKN